MLTEHASQELKDVLQKGYLQYDRKKVIELLIENKNTD